MQMLHLSCYKTPGIKGVLCYIDRIFIALSYAIHSD